MHAGAYLGARRNSERILKRTSARDERILKRTSERDEIPSVFRTYSKGILRSPAYSKRIPKRIHKSTAYSKRIPQRILKSTTYSKRTPNVFRARTRILNVLSARDEIPNVF